VVLPNYAFGGIWHNGYYWDKYISAEKKSEDYDCSIGGEVTVFQVSKETYTQAYHEVLSDILQSEFGNYEFAPLAINIQKLRDLYCQGEQDFVKEIPYIASIEEYEKLVSILVDVVRREQLSDADAKTAVDLAIQMTSYLDDELKREAKLREATLLKLNLAVKSEDVAAVGALFDEIIDDQMRKLTLDKEGYKPSPHKILKAIEKAIGKITVDELASVNELAVQRALFSLVARFPEPENSEKICAGATKSKAELHALLVGIEKYEDEHFASLHGAINDLEMQKKALELRGVEDIWIATNVTREQLISHMRELVMDTKCGDLIVFHYSGYAGRERSPFLAWLF